MVEPTRRRSRVLEHFEQQKTKAEEAEGSGGDENPFQDLDEAFGLDGFGPKDGK